MIDVAGLAQFAPLVSVTKIVLVFAVALLNPNKTLVGLVPVVSTVVNPTSLYHVYTLPPFGVAMEGELIASPIQYVEGLNKMAGATGTAFTINVIRVAELVQLLALVSVTYTVVVFAEALLKPS